MENFENFGLNASLLSALSAMDFRKPTEVQTMVIPQILKGKDVFVRAKTGTGKTAAFLLPILQMITASRKPQALIILPTRELALQIDGVAKKLVHHSKIGTTTVYGGVSIRPQIESLRRGTEILIGTPGRIIDLMERGNIDFSNVKFLVLDEADLMLDMGFIEDIELIIRRLPDERQTLLFSATTRPQITKIAERHMNDPVHISVGSDDEIVVTTIKHAYSVVDRFRKFATLASYMKMQKSGRSIIFARTQDTAGILYNIFRDLHMNPILLHGGMTQAKREQAMRNFKEDKNGMLIATNVAARGLDIPDVNDVVNFDAPEEPTVYVHRVGRSARMGKDGKAYTIFSMDQTSLIRDIERYAGIRMERVTVNPEQFAKFDFGKYVTRGRRPRDSGGRPGGRGGMDHGRTQHERHDSGQFRRRRTFGPRN